MRSLHNEDLDLQIKIAKLQTDVQINLSLCIGVLALFIALMISFQQLYVNAADPLARVGFLCGMLFSACFGFFASGIFIKRMYGKRKEMEDLKKQYVW